MFNQRSSVEETDDAAREEGSDDIYVSCCACRLSRMVGCVDDALDLQDAHVDATSVGHVIEFDRHGPSDGRGEREKPGDRTPPRRSEPPQTDE